MTLNPSHDLKVLLPMMLETVKQNMTNLDAIDDDELQQLTQVREALNSLITAKQKGAGKSDPGQTGGQAGGQHEPEKKSPKP